MPLHCILKFLSLLKPVLRSVRDLRCFAERTRTMDMDTKREYQRPVGCRDALGESKDGYATLG